MLYSTILIKLYKKMDEYYNKAIRLITNGGDKHNE